MSHHRDFCHQVKALLVTVVLCTLIFLSSCRPCTMSGMEKQMDRDECGSCINGLNSHSEDVLTGGGQIIMPQSSTPKLNLENVCSQSDLFRFPSTLSGFFSDSLSAGPNTTGFSEANSDKILHVGLTQPTNSLCGSSKCGKFELLSDRVLSCSLTLNDGIQDNAYCQHGSMDHDNICSCRRPIDGKTPGVNQDEVAVRNKSGVAGDFSTLHVHISPPLLNWGQKYLYFPSLAFLTVENSHSHSVLVVHEPYSTNGQFYPCNFTEIRLGPGEVTSICIVFLPTRLGLSSAHLILQTSFGGFLIQAKGFAVEPPYGIYPLVGYEYSSSGRWSKTISLFNTFDEPLHVKEASVWISFSSGNTSLSAKAVCSAEDPEGSFMFSSCGVGEWLDVKSCHDGQPQMAMRPGKTWEVGPNSNETILELALSYHSQGKISGSVFVQFESSSRDELDAVIVPFEAEFGGRTISDNLQSSPSISLEVLVPCDAYGKTTVALLMENAGPHLLTVVKISIVGVDTDSFKTKHVEGLMLFPHTVTQVGTVTYTPFSVQLGDRSLPIPHSNLNCTLLIRTNKSDSPELKIPCSDIADLCPQSQSYVGYEHYHGVLDYHNAETRSSDNHVQTPMEIKAIETIEPDELVLRNWRSQATVDGISILDNNELLFPLVHIGTHHSEWIRVRNPSNQPVLVQLLLNSGETVTDCRGSNDTLQPSSHSSFVDNDHTYPSKYGFSLARNASTEAYVHANSSMFLGPIVFHPSNRCTWRTSVLVRNNLSGVEWLSLIGFGGSLSLLIFEGSDAIRTVEFKHNVPIFLNFSHFDVFSTTGDINRACGEPSTKVLFAKNAGDLPLDVHKIEVSGTECGLDGFVVHTCKRFSLQPGQSTEVIISYRADFSAATVWRDLELAMSGGILVIPMKASFPSSMLAICKRSLLWIRLKKFLVLVILGFLIFMVCTHAVSWRYGKYSVPFVGFEPNSQSVNCSQKYCSEFVNRGSIDEGETFMVESVRKQPDFSDIPSETRKPDSCVNEPVTAKEAARPLSPLSSKSAAVAKSSPTAAEPPQPGNLTVKIGKEKARRRKKKRGHGTLSTAQFEVSSSQSSNSTPTSPSSPFSSFTPNRSHDTGAKNPSGTVNEVNPKAPTKNVGQTSILPVKEKPSKLRKSVMLPSSTSPCGGRGESASVSDRFPAAAGGGGPRLRAPGSERKSAKAAEVEKSGNLDKFEYDIWGDHLGLCFAGLSKEASVMSPGSSGSVSFFAKGPQSVLTVSKAKPVSSNRNG